jgi:hypothetical protein
MQIAGNQTGGVRVTDGVSCGRHDARAWSSPDGIRGAGPRAERGVSGRVLPNLILPPERRVDKR